MKNPVTVFAPFKLAAGRTEADLLEASDKFQKDFVDAEPGVLRRELVRKNNGEYLDIVQFSSREDALAVMEKEKESPACHVFFSVMAMEAADDANHCIEFYQSLKTYGRNA
jgi:hypothetical protein